MSMLKSDDAPPNGLQISLQFEGYDHMNDSIYVHRIFGIAHPSSCSTAVID